MPAPESISAISQGLKDAKSEKIMVLTEAGLLAWRTPENGLVTPDAEREGRELLHKLLAAGATPRGVRRKTPQLSNPHS